MKDQVKKFSEFINESRVNERRHNRPRAARVDLSSGMGGEFATITFNGEEIEVDEADSLRATWQSILDIARDMGADAIYSVEDGKIITQEEIDLLDDTPTEW